MDIMCFVCLVVAFGLCLASSGEEKRKSKAPLELRCSGGVGGLLSFTPVASVVVCGCVCVLFDGGFSARPLRVACVLWGNLVFCLSYISLIVQSPD